MDVISSVNSAIKLVLRLREVAKNINEAEIRSLIADLANELSDVKLALAEQKERLASLMEENRVLKETRLSEREDPSEVKFGCYKFEGEEGLYCTTCYDTKGIRIRVPDGMSHLRCPVCGTVFT